MIRLEGSLSKLCYGITGIVELRKLCDLKVNDRCTCALTVDLRTAFVNYEGRGTA